MRRNDSTFVYTAIAVLSAIAFHYAVADSNWVFVAVLLVVGLLSCHRAVCSSIAPPRADDAFEASDSLTETENLRLTNIMEAFEVETGVSGGVVYDEFCESVSKALLALRPQ